MLGLFVTVAIAAAVPLQTKQVPLAEGAWPAFPMVESAFVAGASTCTAAVTVGADGAVGQVEVSGCAEPFLAVTRDAIVGMKVSPGFAAKNPTFQVAVPYEPPPIGRRAEVGKVLGEEERRAYTLEQAVAVGQPPVQIVTKHPFARPGTKPGMCGVEVYLDDIGSVYAVDMRDCRADLHLPIEMAVLAWTFEPVTKDGVAAPVHFRMPISVHR